MRTSFLTMSLAFSMQSLEQCTFGVRSPFATVRTRSPLNPPRKQPKMHQALANNKMPLTKDELRVLASFNPGKTKKMYVRSLRVKYGHL